MVWGRGGRKGREREAHRTPVFVVVILFFAFFFFNQHFQSPSRSGSGAVAVKQGGPRCGYSYGLCNRCG